MVTIELNDEDSVDAIRAFVRNTPDFNVYEYVRRGCNGDVYFGKRIKMNDDVVLKFYWSHPNYDETEEAVVLRNIDHTNILKIYDLRFLSPNFSVFITPRISGGDLQGIIDNKMLSSKETLDIIAGVLLGLTELHSQHKLVHRDLKPGNILFDLDRKIPIIADLGAVRKIDEADGFVSASKSTYLYLPPEAISSNRYYFQSDIYQVGVLMYQLLGGYFPINSQVDWLTSKEKKLLEGLRSTAQQEQLFEGLMGNKIMSGRLLNLQSLPYYLDRSFKRVLNKALNLNYAKRYQNAALFLREVHELMRLFPDYVRDSERLLVVHENGTKFQLYRNKKGEIVLEKRLAGKSWRKDGSHDGTIESALKLTRFK